MRVCVETKLKWNKQFEYPRCVRSIVDGRRKYEVAGERLPSVTTILGDTGDKTALIAWRKRVGEAEATRISTESAGLGTKVHNALEKFILQEDYQIKGNNHISVMAKSMVNIGQRQQAIPPGTPPSLTRSPGH